VGGLTAVKAHVPVGWVSEAPAIKANQERKAFFSEEKKQKTFISCPWPTNMPHHKEQKFFGSFFQKRTSYFFCPCP
jgi:hypothetical protein